MKRFLTIMMAASAIFALSSCKEDKPVEIFDAPSITWAGNEDFSTVDITEDLNASLTVKAEAGIKSLTVDVRSDIMESALEAIGIGTTTLDLIGDQQVIAILDAVSQGALPTGDALLNKTEVDFNISSLVKMINAVTEEDSNHTFVVKVTDNADKSSEASCTFHRVGVVSVSVADADLWANTATLAVKNATSVEYRVKGTEDWNTVEAADGVYTIVPEWEESTNDAGLTIYTVKAGTGIYAGNVYEFRINGEILEGADYTAGDGDVIPNGDMSQWSLKDGSLPYPNAEGESFWDSGNNSLASAFGANLCQEDPDNEGVAYLSANMVLGSVFAPGNMYTGDFIMSGISGSANFGKVYDWTARPSALKLSYKAEVGVIDKNGSYDSEGESYLGQQDITRVYAVVIDWTAQHSVSSGLTEPAGMWDPATANSVEEGKIIGYASLNITENQADFTDVEIPFVWYDTEAKPASGNYSIVISCATSNRGDYLTGCSTNKLWVDNFEWVY